MSARCLVGLLPLTHPSLGALEWASSIAVVMASRDDDFTQWTTRLRAQSPDDETTKSIEKIVDLKNMVVERIKAWSTHPKGTLPKKLIVYRDGVSESQLAMVRHEVIPAIEAAISELYDGICGLKDVGHPLLLVLCTIKRRHTRFFPTDSVSPSV